MTTPFSDVYDFFLSEVKDYRLNALYIQSPTHVEFENYVENWLLSSIVEFRKCDQSLVYSGKYFTTTLTEKNIIMLSQLMKKYWLQKEVDDIRQMNLHVQDKDFKTFSENANMKAKQDRLIQQTEKNSQDLVEYELNYNVPWANWFSGNFYVPS